MKAKEILDEFHDNIIAVMDSHEDKYHEAVDEAQEKALLALKEMVESMPRTPYINKCCQEAREEAITAVAELFGGRK